MVGGKTFSDVADGYGRGEGCVMIALRRLSDAQTRGERVLAVIRGSAINHDGSSSGLTVPNENAQVAVIKDALANGHVTPASIHYVEAHGTGTHLGDPIEIQALEQVYGSATRSGPVPVGSIKNRIGHLESAAGLAGLAKVLCCLHHRALPPEPVQGQVNSHIDWDNIHIGVNRYAYHFPDDTPVDHGCQLFWPERHQCPCGD